MAKHKALPLPKHHPQPDIVYFKQIEVCAVQNQSASQSVYIGHKMIGWAQLSSETSQQILCNPPYALNKHLVSTTVA